MFVVALACLLSSLSYAMEKPFFSSPAGSEHVVTFQSHILTEIKSLDDLEGINPEGRQTYVLYRIRPLMKFLFGPATHRSIGGPNGDDFITVAWDRARIVDGFVELPYTYRGVWILAQNFAERGKFKMPVPRTSDLFTKKWKRCGDSLPEHASPSSFWYYWDPARPGCDHVEGREYTQVEFHVGNETMNNPVSFPEYARMIQRESGARELKVTIAFGYVTDLQQPDPDRDLDLGAMEYRAFVRRLREARDDWQEEVIDAREYPFSGAGPISIGRRFRAEIHGVPTQIQVVINATVDQIVLFAKSFAHDHDALFAWMGHSRVGEGFDAAKFSSLLASYPDYFSITRDYQMVYWGGCNSYSYYTLPFFKMKADANPMGDPHGTKNLDIIAHGLPSYFSLNARNAGVVLSAVLNWPSRVSYQQILKGIEENGRSAGISILSAVLGDEDNPATESWP